MSGPRPRPPVERFWPKVERRGPDECWPWVGARQQTGYGILFKSSRPRRWHLAHRLSWELHNGPIPDGLHVLHRCDNPPCVNPAHLFLGTQADNNRDRDAKSRGGLAREGGEGNPRARLTWAIVDEIRGRHAAGETQVALAKHFGVKQPQVSRIIRNQSWVR
jgi:hypothetical protein